MGSLIRKVAKAKKIVAERKKNKAKKNPRRDTEMGVSKNGLIVFRLIMAAFFIVAIVSSGYAPSKSPKLPEGVSNNSLSLSLLIAIPSDHGRGAAVLCHRWPVF